MAYDLQKRLTALQEQTERGRYWHVKFSRVFFYSFISLAVVFYLLSSNNLTDEQVRATAQQDLATGEQMLRGSTSGELSKRFQDSAANIDEDSIPAIRWFLSLKKQVTERTEFIKSLPFGDTAAENYYNAAIERTSLLLFGDTQKKKIDLFMDSAFPLIIEKITQKNRFEKYILSTTLTIIFVFKTFWIIWLLAAILGFVVILYIQRQKHFDPILSICDRGKGPFYSGIYGPFRLTGTFGGMELTCPGLACPEMVNAKVASSHHLIKILSNFGGLCETTQSLVRIILAYRDYPCVVDEERPVEEDKQVTNKPKVDTSSPDVGLATNTEGTIEKNSLELLPALLSAHKFLRSYFASKGKKSEAETGDNFSTYTREIEQLGAKLSPLAKSFLLMPTPARAKAFAGLSPKAVATAYLALEAGKSLVYKRGSNGNYVKISQFPHLQSRAVLHSIPEFHTEFDADTRLIIRQAIICSRRHGDFARSFLPDNMPTTSRALRDYLEVLYTAKAKREDIALITELDAYTEEVLNNWREQYLNRLEELAHSDISAVDQKTSKPWFSKGVVYKSVILIPQNQLVDIALVGLSKERLKRISELMRHARRFRKSLAVSARLPGFKRQIDESDESIEKALDSNNSEIMENWLIIRRMLTRYNWLSTRVGDDAVPSSGLLQGIVIDRHANEKTEVVGFDALVPLRHRRLKELLGNHWEQTFFIDSPHPNDIAVFVDHEQFERELSRKMELNKKGLLDAPTHENASTGSGK